MPKSLRLSLKCIAGLEVKVEIHHTLNLCKGVVTHEDFYSESEEYLKSIFEPEGRLYFCSIDYTYFNV